MKKKLLNYYEYHLDIIKRSKKGLKWNLKYCQKYNIARGLCFCAIYTFDKNICNDTWIKNIKNYENPRDLYWTTIPYYANSNKELIKCLEYRINKLKK